MALKTGKFVVQNKKTPVLNDAFEGLKEKRRFRARQKAKYTKRADKTPEDYKNLRVKMRGRTLKLSDSTKFFLDHMEQAPGAIEIVDGDSVKTVSEGSGYMMDMLIKEE